AADRAQLCVAFMADGRSLAVGGLDGRIRVWDVNTRRLTQVLANRKSVRAVAFSPDSGRLAALTDSLNDGSLGEALRVWDRAGNLVAWAEDLPEGCAAFQFPADGRVIALVRVNDQGARLWDPISCKDLPGRVGACQPFKGVAFSHDCRLFATCDGQTIHIRESFAGRDLFPAYSRQQPISALALSADGRLVASAGFQEPARLWDASRGEALGQFNTPLLRDGERPTIESLAFSPDGRLLAAGTQEDLLLRWEVESGRMLPTFTAPDTFLGTVTFSPDGRRIVARSGTGTIF